MNKKSNLIEANLVALISRYLKGEKPTTFFKECIFLWYETNKLLKDKSLLSAYDRYCEFLLSLFNFYEVNSTIRDVRKHFEENFSRCMRFVEKGDEYPEDQTSISQILDWLVDDYVTLTGQRLPIFYEFEKFRTNQIRDKFALNN